MTSEGLGEMFEGDSADTCGRKFPLMSMGAERRVSPCADPGARTPLAWAECYSKSNWVNALPFVLNALWAIFWKLSKKAEKAKVVDWIWFSSLVLFMKKSSIAGWRSYKQKKVIYWITFSLLFPWQQNISQIVKIIQPIFLVIHRAIIHHTLEYPSQCLALLYGPNAFLVHPQKSHLPHPY